MAEGCVLKLGVSINDEVIVANRCEVSTRRCKSDVLNKGLRDAHLLDVLRLDSLAIL